MRSKTHILFETFLIVLIRQFSKESERHAKREYQRGRLDGIMEGRQAEREIPKEKKRHLLKWRRSRVLLRESDGRPFLVTVSEPILEGNEYGETGVHLG